MAQVLRQRAPELGLLSRLQKDQFAFAFAVPEGFQLEAFAPDLHTAVHDLLSRFETPEIRRQAQVRAAHRRIYNSSPPTGRALPAGLSATLALVFVRQPSLHSAQALADAAQAALLQGKRSGGGAVDMAAL
jgi:GGDEF domain-containing protein